ncbi:MAG: hypothetical protein AAGA75_21485 [Cyanobacteria bacterium P01_E01_bin.6]
MAERKNPQRTITLTTKEDEDLLILAEFLNDNPASIVRDAWVAWYRSDDAQNLIQRARAAKTKQNPSE